MTIIDKTQPPSPKCVYKPKPFFKTSLAQQRYWDKQFTYYREGYGTGHARISGMHYFYLQECFLKDGSDATIIRPRYRDCDEWIIDELHKGFWKPTEAIGVVKRRELGLTSIGAGLLPAYTFMFYPGATFAMTSADKDRIFKAFTDKTQPIFNEMDEQIRPVISKQNENKQNVYLQLATKRIDHNGKENVVYSEFWAKETSQSDKSASGLSGTRLKAAFFDELPLHQRNRRLLRSSKPCFLKNLEWNGLLLWGGSFEEALTAEQIQGFQRLIADAEMLRHKVIFAPAWWGLVLNSAGESDEKAGIEKVMRERDAIESTGDVDELRAHKLNFPLKLEDIFDLGHGSRWEEYTREKINLRVNELLSEQPPISGWNIIES